MHTYTKNKLALNKICISPLLSSNINKKHYCNNIYWPISNSFMLSSTMAMKAVHVSEVIHLDQLHQDTIVSPSSQSIEIVGRSGRAMKGERLKVVGHRGNGMNRLLMSDPRMSNIKENSILSFNTAAAFDLDFIEFDVQVTKDGCPIIFHDNVIFTEENGKVVEKNVTELTLSEFLSYGPQKEASKVGKPLFRKTKDGKLVRWDVKSDDALCTLQETFENTHPKLGFNIELKFDSSVTYQQHFLLNVLQPILEVVFKSAKHRPIIFSSFDPDAAVLVRKLQDTYPVFFLTDAGTEIYHDERRNTLEEAIKLCLEGHLQGIVSQVKGIFRNPHAVSKIKDAQLSLFTYGTLNNVPESVYLQHLMGIDGVIVDFVQEITEAVNGLMKQEKDEEMEMETKPNFSNKELSFLFKLIPELIQQ